MRNKSWKSPYTHNIVENTASNAQANVTDIIFFATSKFSQLLFPDTESLNLNDDKPYIVWQSLTFWTSISNKKFTLL